MLRMVVFIGALCVWFARLDADDKTAVAKDSLSAHRLPIPLHDITCDFGQLEQHFTIVECKLYPPDEFKVDKRVVAEETLVWVLEARRSITGREVFPLLHPKGGITFPKVQFFAVEDGQEVVADAKPQGYRLIRDSRFIDIKRSPDLGPGSKLKVWVHLGKEGSAGLVEKNATKLRVCADK